MLKITEADMQRTVKLKNGWYLCTLIGTGPEVKLLRYVFLNRAYLADPYSINEIRFIMGDDVDDSEMYTESYDVKLQQIVAESYSWFDVGPLGQYASIEPLIVDGKHYCEE